jgi:hypothetical protein
VPHPLTALTRTIAWNADRRPCKSVLSLQLLSSPQNEMESTTPQWYRCRQSSFRCSKVRPRTTTVSSPRILNRGNRRPVSANFNRRVSEVSRLCSSPGIESGSRRRVFNFQPNFARCVTSIRRQVRLCGGKATGNAPSDAADAAVRRGSFARRRFNFARQF